MDIHLYLEVNNPDLYEQFKTGHFTIPYKKYTVTTGATPNPLGAAKLFADSYYPLIKFVDRFNYIQLTPNERHAEAYSTTKRVNLVDMPTNYKSYSIVFANQFTSRPTSIIPTVADLDAMETWTLANEIVINLLGSHSPDQLFWDRLHELQKTGRVIKNVKVNGPLVKP